MGKYSIEDEKLKINAYSPCIVDDTESLLRMLLNPEHVSPEGKFSNAAIKTDDLFIKGVSIEREAYYDNDSLKIIAMRQMEKDQEHRKCAELAHFLCSDIRGIKCTDDDKSRLFIVIDEALPENIAHAAIYTTMEEKSVNKAMIKSIKTKLTNFFNNRIVLVSESDIKPEVDIQEQED